MPAPPACATCGRSNPVELQMTTKSGQVLTMVSCTRCEARTWFADGRRLDMKDVLKATSGDPDFEVTPAARRTPAPRRPSRAGR